MFTKSVFAFVAFAALWDTGSTVIGWIVPPHKIEVKR